MSEIPKQLMQYFFAVSLELKLKINTSVTPWLLHTKFNVAVYSKNFYHCPNAYPPIYINKGGGKNTEICTICHYMVYLKLQHFYDQKKKTFVATLEDHVGCEFESWWSHSHLWLRTKRANLPELWVGGMLYFHSLDSYSKTSKSWVSVS